MQRLFIFLLLIFSDLRVFSQTSDNVLNSLINQSLAYYPALKAQQQNIKLAEIRRQVTKSQFMPTLSADAGYLYVNPIPQAVFSTPDFTTTPITVRESALQFQPANNYNTALNANMLIYDFGRTNASLEKSRTDIQFANDNAAASQHTLAYQVANLYYGVIYLQKAIEVQNAQLSLLQANEKVISDRIRNGDEIDFNLISTQVRYKNTQTRTLDLQNQLEKQLISLGSLVGKDVHAQIDPKADFKLTTADIDPESTVSQAQTGNWDLKLSQDREKFIQTDLLIASRGFYPALSFNGSVGFKNGIQPDIYQFRFNTALGVRLSIPIYNGNRLRFQSDAARTGFEQAKYQTEAQSITVRAGIEQANQDIKTVQQKLDLSAAQVRQAEYAVRLAETRYKNGVITSLEQLTAQTALQEAQLNSLQYEYQLALARLEVNRLLGVKFW
jgi:outer membrane protein